MARLPYVDAASALPEVREVFRKLEHNGARILKVHQMFAHSPAVMLPFIKMGNSLLVRASLDAKLREIAVLRVAVLGGAEYEWRQHVSLALDADVAEAQIDAVTQWEDSSAFDDREKAVLRFADELAKTGDLSDEAFARVSSFLNDTEIVELTASIVYWEAIARFLVALRVEPEEGGGVLGKYA